ncbi:methylosome protein WDR77-like [Anticarsia gemmatalis]|uniref:methylosome protein WDR77-like n=1 Tax=Anticarsia gemmatalis TaxID=129554 RepID=UPI003F764B61
MENSNKIVPPHLNAEIYRTDTTGTSTLSYLDYIRIHSDGSILVGSSELTGRYWNGGASIYKDINEARKIQTEEKLSIPLTSGSADGCFIESSNKVFLCEDSGAVSVWTREEQPNAWNQWTEQITVSEHDDIAFAVECLDPGQHYVTVGGDGHAKVWDIQDLICVKNYLAAHSLMIYAVAVKPKSRTCFATGSMDQCVTLWDENVDKPVLDLLNNDCGIRCLAWIDDHRLVAGDEAGVLRLIDVRNTETDVKIAEFPAAVHKLSVHSECDKVAVCCDNKIVSVCDTTQTPATSVIYHDRHRHTNYVRGLAWDLEDKKTLHSVGWNGEIKSHNVVWN